MKLLIAVLETLISLYLTNGAYVVRNATEYGRNVCIIGSEVTHVKLHRTVTSSRETIVKDCGISQGPIIDCEEHVIKAVISYVPETKTERVSKIDCCPGWKNYNRWFGCFKRITFILYLLKLSAGKGWLKLCSVKAAPCLSLPKYTPSHCVARRHAKLALNRNTYTLHKPPPRVTKGDPGNSGNLQNYFAFPLINLTGNQSIKLASQDADELPWLRTYIYLQNSARTFLREQSKQGAHLFEQYNSTADFDHLLQRVRRLFTKDGKYPGYFRYPSEVEKWKDIIRCDMWQDDQVFVEQRLAALNPMSLQRVTANEGYSRKKVGLKFSELVERLNPSFDWNNTISNVVGRKTSLYKMVKRNSVFAIHFPYLDEISNVPDITNIHKRRELKKATSPIALFVSVKSSKNKPYELKPVAIQINNHEDSPVHTPADGNRWLLAKLLYQVADFAYVEMIEHLLKTHMILQPICVVAKRTISKYHPLNELFRWHCRGLITTNVIGFPKLIRPKGYMHRLFSIGHVGGIELLNKGYMDYSWKDTDFWENIRKRGVADQKKLPYFPYRDDGKLIWQQIQSYVHDYVSLYYGEDEDVSSDSELENFTNELSEDGFGKTGGIGKLKGFPRRLRTKSSLIETLSRILWLPIQHNTVNFPIAYYGAFVPNMPTKLYDDPRGKADEYSFYNLPDKNVATVQAVVSMSLGSLRFDNLLDYGPQMVDQDAAKVVKKHYRILNTRVKAIIDQRNDERFKEGHLTYPYLKPGWIPNSINT